MCYDIVVKHANIELIVIKKTASVIWNIKYGKYGRAEIISSRIDNTSKQVYNKNDR